MKRTHAQLPLYIFRLIWLRKRIGLKLWSVPSSLTCMGPGLTRRPARAPCFACIAREPEPASLHVSSDATIKFNINI